MKKLILKMFALETLQHELYRRGYALIKGSVWKWLFSLLDSYARETGEKEVVDKIKTWINNQPTSC